MNPNLNHDKAYLRQGNKMSCPINPSTGKRFLDGEYDSISAAKRHSRELMAKGHTIITKEKG